MADHINFAQMNASNDLVYFNYYSSDYANVINDAEANGMFMKILVPNIYSTHCTIDRLEIIFKDFDGNEYKYSMNSYAFDKYFQDVANYKKIIPGLSELLEIPIYIEFRKKGRPINPESWWSVEAGRAGKGKV